MGMMMNRISFFHTEIAADIITLNQKRDDMNSTNPHCQRR